jgi:hypothetical protein
MANMRTIEINSTALKNELRKIHKTAPEVSTLIGFNAQYIANCLGKGKISVTAMKLLTAMFGIKEEDITYPKPELVEVVDSPIDYVKLYNTIYSAVRNAMKDALNADSAKEEK